MPPTPGRRYWQIGLLVGFVGAAIFALTQRSAAFAGLAAGVVLGLAIVLLWAGISRWLLRHRSEEAADRPLGRPCRYCGEMNERSAPMCSRCGAVAKEPLLLGYAGAVVLLAVGGVLWRLNILDMFTAAGVLVAVLVAGLILRLGSITLRRGRHS